MLYEPIQYVITGKRVSSEDICTVMEQLGKEKCLYRMWKGSMPYLQSIANKVPSSFRSLHPFGCLTSMVLSLVQELNAVAAEALANPPE